MNRERLFQRKGVFSRVRRSLWSLNWKRWLVRPTLHRCYQRTRPAQSEFSCRRVADAPRQIDILRFALRDSLPPIVFSKSQSALLASRFRLICRAWTQFLVPEMARGRHLDYLSRFLSILSNLFNARFYVHAAFERVDFVGTRRNLVCRIDSFFFFFGYRYHRRGEDDRREIPLNQPGYLVSISTLFGLASVSRMCRPLSRSGCHSFLFRRFISSFPFFFVPSD